MPARSATEPTIRVFHVEHGDRWGANVVMPGSTVGEARYDFDTEMDAFNWALDCFAVLAAQNRAKVAPLA